MNGLEIFNLYNSASNQQVEDFSDRVDSQLHIDKNENKTDCNYEWIDIIEQTDDYVIQHFRIAFGNRIVMHMKKFVPVYVACGGDEVDGVDYFLAKKILRKFEQLNISYIRDEIDGFVEFLDKTFGKGKMKECEEYVLRLKKLT